ncbi:MAG: STAS domain-containing protein [Pseudomonadota bacterium]
MRHHCTLPEDMFASSLAPMALQLEAVLLDGPERIEIDAHALTCIDGVGMQLLYVFARDARTAGKTVIWHGAGPRFVEAAKILGMAEGLALENQ